MNNRLTNSYQPKRNAFAVLNLQTAISSAALSVVVQFAVFSLVGAASSSAATHVEAYRGEPFGIGRVTIDLEPGATTAPANDNRFILAEANDRVLYPAMKNSSARRILRGLLGIETPRSLTYVFMFRGDEPLDLTAYTPTPQSITVRPMDDAREFNDLVNDWWEATTDRYAQVFREAEYPVLVENYVTATWARRLGRPMPEPKRYLFERFGVGAPWISQLMANEAYQTQVESDLLAGPVSSSDAGMVPLPASTPLGGRASTGAPTTTERVVPAPVGAEANTSIEPLAAHVPQECFYMRFGNFTNYLWFRDFMRHWQGDLGNMLVVNSVDRNISERFQQQIAVGETKLARVMGPTVINDVAIIGFDLYLRDGAAMGILFQANNNLLLGNNLSGQRRDAKGKHADTIDETVKIAGHDVSYYHTPDGGLRSYYAVDGDFHLVANCRKLVERFYESGGGKNTLAATTDFEDCRAAMPLTRDDTIFFYAPAAFLQNLASPHYRIELDRRLRSIGEMRATKLARLAAAAEGQPANSIEDLVAAELLPAGFGQRFDGSQLNQMNGAFRDSLRGDAGWMTPIPDMPIERITPAEARRLARFQQELQSSVGSFAPVCAAMRRTDSTTHKGWDRITADVRVARYSQMPVAKWPAMLGEAQTNRVAPIVGDAVALEVVLGGLGEPVHLFGGIRDANVPLIVRQGEIEPRGSITDAIRAYVGGWPRPHLLDQFLGRPSGPLDAEGTARAGGIGGLFDLWFRRADDFFLFSFHRDVLLDVGRQLAMVEADHPAQVRLHIDDLTNKQISTTVNGLGYMRARDTSASASRFMNSLTTQLHIPASDARAVGEDLVAGKFACPLGGKYVLVDPMNPLVENGNAEGKGAAEVVPPPPGVEPLTHRIWVSTAPPTENQFLLTVIPADYQMPLLQWFRGLSADVARVNDELWLNAELDMVHIEVGPPEDPDAAGGGLLPSLGGLFSGFGPKKDEAVKPASGTEEVQAPASKKK